MFNRNFFVLSISQNSQACFWLQIFPLLVQQFSPKEQAKLVWQYLCSVPIILLEEFLPWLTTTLSSDQKNDFLECISVIVPDEKLLQEVCNTPYYILSNYVVWIPDLAIDIQSPRWSSTGLKVTKVVILKHTINMEKALKFIMDQPISRACSNYILQRFIPQKIN